MKATFVSLLVFLFLGLAGLYSDVQKSEKDLNEDIGFYRVVRVDNTLYISGCTGMGETMEEQLDIAYGKIRERLAEYGIGFESVVKENLYTTDLKATQQAIPHRKAILGENYYAATWVEVKGLWSPSTMVEIEVTAILPEKEKRPKPCCEEE